MRSSLVRTSTLGYALLLALSLLVAFWQGRLAGFFTLPGWSAAGMDLLLGLGLAAGVLALGALARRSFGWARRLDEEFSRLLAPLGVADAFVLAVSSGVAEEVFFRGVLQPAIGLYPASLAFGLLHYPMNRRMVPWTVIAIGMGLLLGIVYDATGHLLPVVTAHALINFVELGRIGSRAPGPV